MNNAIIPSRRTSAHTRGMTLVELIISLLVTMLLSYALYWMLIAGKVIWQSSLTRSSAHQDLQVASLRITQDLKDTSFATLTLNTSGAPSAFSMLSAFDRSGNFVTDALGEQVWQKYVIYYLPSGATTLLRKEVYGTFTAALTAAQLTAYCDGQGQPVARGVTQMSLASAGGNAVALAIQLQNTNSQGKLDQQDRSLTIFTRN